MQKSYSRKHKLVHQHGIAVVTVLVLILVLFSIVTISSLLALGNRRSSADNVVTVKAQYAAEAGIERAMYQIFYKAKENWQASADSAFTVNGRSAEFDTCAFKKWLTGKWQTSDNANRGITKNNNLTCQYYTSAAVANAAVPNLYNDQVPVTITGTTDTNVQFSVTVTRQDDPTSNRIVITMNSLGRVTDGANELAARQLNRSVDISTEPFAGDRFAVLTKAVNCSLCHLHVDSMPRAYADPASANTFNRVRMAVLDEDVNLDPAHNGDTFIGGTLYVRKNVYSTSANEIYSAKWATGTNNKVNAGAVAAIVGKPFGQSDTDPLIDATLIDTPSNPTKANGKVYQKYPTSAEVGPGKTYAAWPDEPVPDNFPTIVPDINNDDFISDSEWSNYIAGAPSGTLVVPSGSSGKIFGVRRPSSASTVVAPISYDPTLVNTSLSGTTPGGNAAVNSANINTAISGAGGLTAGYRAPAGPGAAATVTLTTNFINNYRGWLIQEALASPNNRDYEPGTNNGILAGALFTATLNPNGSTQNNFWVRYDAPNQRLQLLFRYAANINTPHTCPAVPPTNVNFVGANCGILNIPLTDSDIYPSASNSAATTLSSSSVWDGNLIIDAGRINSTNRMVDLDGTININGDVVIRGQIRGKGRIVARGNIYIVGDFVYGCGTTACKIVDGANASYRNPENLPLVGLLAGGVIAAGDYDFPDYRASNGNTAWGANSYRYGGGSFDLVNDQVGRFVQGNFITDAAGNITGQNGSTLPTPLPYYNIPGSTGTNSSRNNCWGDMGFVPMTAANANNRAKDAVDSSGNPASSRRYFKSMPFGLMTARDGFCSYEQGGTELDNGNTATVISLYPSNGPMRTGSRFTSGFSVSPAGGTTQLVNNLACATANGNNFRLNANRFNTGAAALNTGFWCTPASLTGVGYHRKWNHTGDTNNTNPAGDSSSWVLQSAQNLAADGGIGMTTGWLGGVIDGRTSAGNTVFNRLGDISQTRILKLMWLSSMESGRDMDSATSGDQKGPLRTDGIFYSTHGIFTLARSYQNTWQNARSANEGRWTHNGSVIAAELGFLVTGDYTGGVDARFTNNNAQAINFAASPSTGNAGPAMGIFFDERAIGFLQVQTGTAVRIRRIGAFTQANR